MAGTKSVRFATGTLSYLYLIGISFVILYPILYMLSMAFRPSEQVNDLNVVWIPTRLTLEEQRLQFTLWCMLSAPLLLSCDIAGMDEATFRLLTNDDLIAIDQDPLVSPPEIRDCGNGVLEYRKRLADGATAVGLFNRSDEKRSCRLEIERSGRELWSGEERELCGDFAIAPHSVLLFRTADAGLREMVSGGMYRRSENLAAGTF